MAGVQSNVSSCSLLVQLELSNFAKCEIRTATESKLPYSVTDRLVADVPALDKSLQTWSAVKKLGYIALSLPLLKGKVT